MPYYIYNILVLRLNKRLRGRVFGHEIIEGWNSVSAIGLDEECYGNEETEGIMSEPFLNESEVWGRERREGNA